MKHFWHFQFSCSFHYCSLPLSLKKPKTQTQEKTLKIQGELTLSNIHHVSNISKLETSPMSVEATVFQIFSCWCISTSDSSQGGKGSAVVSQHSQKHQLLQGNSFWLGNTKCELVSGFSDLSFQFWKLYFSKESILLRNWEENLSLIWFSSFQINSNIFIQIICSELSAFHQIIFTLSWKAV